MNKYVYIHGGPTGMVVANMAVDGPFFQPANVEGTGSRHSWLWGEQSVHAYITTCGPKASLDTGIPPSLSTWPKETQRLLWNKGLPDTPHNQRCQRMLAWMDMYGGPSNAKPIIAIFNIQHWNNIDSGGGFWPPNIWFALAKFVAAHMTWLEVWNQYDGNQIGVEIHWAWKWWDHVRWLQIC